MVRGLVEQEVIGLLGERTSDQDTLHLAARQRPHAPMRKVRKADAVKGVLDGRIVARPHSAEPATARQPPQQHDIGDVLPDIGRPLLRHDRDAPGNLPSAHPGDGQPVQQDPPGIGSPRPVEKAQQGGLAAAVGADQPKDLAGANGYLDAGQHLLPAKRQPDAFRPDHLVQRIQAIAQDRDAFDGKRRRRIGVGERQSHGPIVGDGTQPVDAGNREERAHDDFR